MEIIIKQLTLINFKGIKDLRVAFGDVTHISGDNGTGKTTIFDAFTWLLFGKDSHDNKEFNIKTLDENGKAIPNIDHVVEGILAIDGQESALRRVYREKWTRRRGAEESELTGHETLFFWNEVPLQAGEYKERVDKIVNEALFKLLTSTTYFNQLPWQKRREILTKIAGVISTDDILSKINPVQSAEIRDIISRGEDLIKIQAETAMRRKKLQGELQQIPPRIDEANRSMPETLDFPAISKELEIKRSLIAEINSTIEDQTKAYNDKSAEVRATQNEILKLRRQIQQLQFDAETQANLAVNQAKTNRSTIESQIKTEQRVHVDYLSERSKICENRTRLEGLIVDLRKDWEIESAKVFKIDQDFTCPTCKRPLDPDVVAAKTLEMERSFDKQKNIRLNQINTDGQTRREQLSGLEEFFQMNEESIKAQEAKITKLQEELDGHIIPETAVVTFDDSELRKQIDELELTIIEIPPLNIEGLKIQRESLQLEIEVLNLKLYIKSQIEQAQKRITELKAEERSMAQQISDLERREFAIESYTHTKMDMVEQRVNGRFNLVTFRMFTQNLNGSIEECCDTILNGVPYPDVNSAGKIQAGVDIINTLSVHYGIKCPCWIDNRETINKIPPTDLQIINLWVTQDKELIINH